ncbi:MAG: DUF1571 domain-containing protein [Planctomycetota bacterium]
MIRLLPVLGSMLLLGGVWAVADGVEPTGDEANGEEIASAPADAKTLIRVASADSQLLIDRPADSPSARALRQSAGLLRDGLKRLDAIPAYTATFRKREAVDGVLLDPQTMDLTLRHEPFGVHLAWVKGQRGRTLLYEAGRNDGDMLVNPGGWKGRLTGTVRLDPEGALAKREARQPVTMLGLERLAAKMLKHRLEELERPDEVVCTLADGFEHDGRPAWKNVLEYRSPQAGGEFRKSVVLIDREWSLPVKVETYGWPSDDVAPADLDARTLLGRYEYAGIDLESLADEPAVEDLAAFTGFVVK